MKDLKVKKLPPQLTCHPRALPAFQFTQFIFHFNRKLQSSEPRLALLARITTLSSILKPDENLFFEGWMPLICDQRNERRKTYSAGLSDIEGRAWMYALQAIVILSSKQSYIRNVALFFAHAPKGVQIRLFGGRLPRTVLARTIAFSGESRASVRRILNAEVPNV
ncbi:hypothetical protein Q3O60_05190 [Alkalimonas collagenimarina]|uniref:Uncharacterized protein n=1 Tax=Alkalimonas collagenimarina TaxID=400390 RepID=A0ABT9GX24_9GAMM|nr:hypothetical protein [Alkalimonas collagenimarina]MDP4535573.1 hypothetical protein [Alkalimonas collagenimarina]